MWTLSELVKSMVGARSLEMKMWAMTNRLGLFRLGMAKNAFTLGPTGKQTAPSETPETSRPTITNNVLSLIAPAPYRTRQHTVKPDQLSTFGPRRLLLSGES
jgi:hypothetical protein